MEAISDHEENGNMVEDGEFLFFIVRLCLLDYLNPGYYPKYQKEMSILVGRRTCFYGHNNVSSLAHVGL